MAKHPVFRFNSLRAHNFRVRMILHIYLPNWFSVFLRESHLGMENPEEWKPEIREMLC